MMQHATVSVVARRAGGIFVAVFALAASMSGAAQAQAPGSVFGQQPQQLQQQFQAPPTSSSVVPFKKPTSTAPNWNAVGSNPAPAFTPPPAVSTQARRPATPAAPLAAPRAAPAKPSAAAKNVRRPAGPKFAKFMPNRAALLQAQIKIRDDENRIAQRLRGHALAQQARATGTGGAFAQAPGRTSSLFAAAEARSPLAARNAKTQDALAAQPDGIWSVNGKVRDFIVTPGGNVVIFGKGFGTTPGQVVAKGVVAVPAFHVTGWNSFEIDATLPAGIRGVPDMDGISVQVVTSAGKSFTLGNGKFVATREEIPFDGDINAWEDLIYLITGDGQPDLQVIGNSWLLREKHGRDMACGHPGVDQFFFKDLPNGFQLSGITLEIGTPIDTGDGDGKGNPGNHMLIGSYHFGEFDRRPIPLSDDMTWHIPIYWGIYRSHTSPSVIPPGLGGSGKESDECSSYYSVTASVVGPAGLVPYPNFR